MLGFVIPKVSWMNSGRESQARLPAEVEPCLLMELKGVDQHTVVIEDGKEGRGGRNQGVNPLLSGQVDAPAVGVGFAEAPGRTLF